MCVAFIAFVGASTSSASTSRAATTAAGAILFHSDRAGAFDLYVVDTNGLGQRRLTDDPAHDFWASWSPDGPRIAFTSAREGNFDIYTMNEDGSGSAD